MVLSVFFAYTAAGQNKDKWKAPESSKKLKSLVPSDNENLAAGKTLYAKHCKSCHGASGKGDGPKAAQLEKECGDFTSAEFKSMTDGEIYWMTTEGKDPMPTYEKKMTDEERWQVVQYVRTLGEKK